METKGRGIKYRDGHWHVYMDKGWLRCDSEEDARELSASAELTYLAFEGYDDQEIAAKLDRCIDLCLKYGEEQHANFLREVTKLVRHQPSAFDGKIWD